MEKITINFVVPELSKDKFSGGIYCVLKHAHLLSEKGHTVNIIPVSGCDTPNWIDCKANFIFKDNDYAKYKWSLIKRLLGKEFVASVLKKEVDYFLLARRVPAADITIATLWSTAQLVYESGQGVRAYFCQHFESVFHESGSTEELLASFSYQYPIHKIANSLWLRGRLTSYLGERIQEKIEYAHNGVDIDKFKRSSSLKQRGGDKVKIISYGGRNVEWKGFIEMAKAISSVRAALPNYDIDWRVFGGAALPVENGVARYTDLGFLQTEQLAIEYQEADILLSASWYESFPLFPLEAMSCGLAVITTRNGTEDYAVDQVNSIVVEEKNVASLSSALKRLVTDPAFCQTLGENGMATAQRFSWDIASNKMEETLLSLVGKGKVLSRKNDFKLLLQDK